MFSKTMIELKYSNTNTYLIRGRKGLLLFDTGWAGTFAQFCRMLGENKIKLQDIGFLMISHFHPDHMGIAQEIANNGVTVVAADVQAGFIHSSDHIFAKENNSAFIPIDDSSVRMVTISESRSFLGELGISGEIIHTPGHSDDSISLWLDRERALFVGDLNPLYELEMHKGTQIEESWNRLLALDPKTVYYGHAKTAELSGKAARAKQVSENTDTYSLVKKIMKLIDKGCDDVTIQQKTGADKTFIRDVARMYLTHQNVSVQGILDRIEIKGK
ncbi:MAG: MBL fold metallo-hydrolase [Ruminococcus sp.]|nr:MBL fold metallo-hydrolase [Ruminococcus sp.]